MDVVGASNTKSVGCRVTLSMMLTASSDTPVGKMLDETRISVVINIRILVGATEIL